MPCVVEAPGIEPGARTLRMGSLYSGSAHRHARFGTLTHPCRGQRGGQTARSIRSVTVPRGPSLASCSAAIAAAVVADIEARQQRAAEA
jgi:hypothetical protein